MEKFEFNKYGVCVNPEIINIDKHISLQIAQDIDGRYCAGYDIQFNNHFHIKPCMSILGKKIDTKKEALEYAVREVILDIENHSKDEKTSLENCLDYLRSILYKQLELELF